MVMNGKLIEPLPMGVIKPDSHSFSPYLECFCDKIKVNDIHMIDARTALAYRFVRKKGKILYNRITLKPVLEEVPIDMIRLSKGVTPEIKSEFETFVRRFVNFGTHKRSVSFGLEV